MKVYNKHALTRNQRFAKALLYGIAATIVCIVVYVVIANALPFESSLLYIGFGYAIGYVIKTYGRGVQPRFQILAAVLAILCFLIGDAVVLTDWSILMNPVWLFEVIKFDVSLLIGTGLNGLLGLAFRALGVYFAYTESRIV